VENKGTGTWFDEVQFVHYAVPNFDLNDVDITVNFLGRDFKAPIIIAGMTGGHETAARINAELARVAEELGIGMGVGSQRAAIENPRLAYTYAIVRETAPNAFIIANIGAAQIARGYSIDEVKRIINMVKANALAVHFNPAHECLQLEGEPSFKGSLDKLREITSTLEVPVIAKEVGFGISKEAAEALAKVGVRAIDVGGSGGTNWALVEYYRAKKSRSKIHERLCKLLIDWGIPTAVSICEVRSVLPKIPLIATGGIRTGLDIAKAIALGADVVGIGLPLLRLAYKGGSNAVISELRAIIHELKVVMFLVGAQTLYELREVPLILGPRLSRWLKLRGIDPEEFSRSRA